jgi:hypothetical protein
MKITLTASALLLGLTLAVSASAQSAVSTYSKVKLLVTESQPKAAKVAFIEGTLNLDPESRNVLFVVKESVRKTIPYQNISSLQFFMANHLLRILYRNSSGVEEYIDMDLPGERQPDLLKQIQAQTGIAIRLS